MSKQLENLVAKAQVKGFARINGRQREYYGFGSSWESEIMEKYSVEIKDSIVKLKHWETKTLEIDTEKKSVNYVYGISNSDRDSVNFILNKFNVPYHVHYYPSRDEFELHDNQENIIEII